MHIGPALAGGNNQTVASANFRRGLGPRAHSTLGNFALKNGSKIDHTNGAVVPLQTMAEGNLQITNKEKEKFADRINLDR